MSSFERDAVAVSVVVYGKRGSCFPVRAEL